MALQLSVGKYPQLAVPGATTGIPRVSSQTKQNKTKTTNDQWKLQCIIIIYIFAFLHHILKWFPCLFSSILYRFLLVFSLCIVPSSHLLSCNPSSYMFLLYFFLSELRAPFWCMSLLLRGLLPPLFFIVHDFFFFPFRFLCLFFFFFAVFLPRLYCSLYFSFISSSSSF